MAIKMSEARISNFIWNVRSLFLVICASFLSAALLSKIVDPSQTERIFNIFAIAPFAVIPLLFRLRASAVNLAKNSNLLSVFEQRRFADTAKKRMQIYSGAGLLNLIAGILCVFALLLDFPDKSSAFALSFAVCLAGLTAVISFFEDGSYSAIIQSLERRRTNKNRKTDLLKGIAQRKE